MAQNHYLAGEDILINSDGEFIGNAELVLTDKGLTEPLHETRNHFQQKTLNEVIEEFLAFKNSEQTQRAYRGDLTDFFQKNQITYLRELATIPYYEIVQLSLQYINSFRKSEKYRPQKVLNPKTINRKAYSLSSFFKYLVNVYNYPKNPIANFTPLKVQRRSTTTSLNRGELADILQYAKAHRNLCKKNFRDYLLLSMLFTLALRRNEIANLKWSDIDYEREAINVFQKGGSYKELPLPEPLLNLLLEYKKEYGRSSAYIFHPIVNNRTKDLRKPISTDLIFKIVKKIAARVVPDKKITPHSFRKTFIEFALNNRQDYISIINATGHTTIEMVKYYDTRDNLKNNAVNQLADFI